MEFPVCLQDIGKFEKSNDLSVNVFGYEKGYVYPLRISSKHRERVADLLLISDDEKQHYCLIKSLSRLLASQVSKMKRKRYYCRRCLNSYNREDKLNIIKNTATITRQYESYFLNLELSWILKIITDR